MSESELELGEFQSFLRGAMKSRGWSIGRLGRETGISSDLIYRWLRHERPIRPSPANLKKLAPVLGVSESELLRLAGHLAVSSEEPVLDPDLIVINSAWPRLSGGVREAMKILATSVGALTLRQPASYANAQLSGALQ